MERKEINLGTCIIQDIRVARLSEMLDIIEGFGLTHKELFSINPSCKDITELYDSILGYRKAVKFFRELRKRIAN